MPAKKQARTEKIPEIYFAVALPAEARPIIDYYRLRTVPNSGPFRVYESEDIRLIVSGPGKIPAASAVGFLYAFSGGMRNRIWLNVGIAGHRDFQVGTGVLAHKITDQSSGQNWYPPIVFDPPCETESVLTVDRPVVYGDGSGGDRFTPVRLFEPVPSRTVPDAHCVYEMEAAGFYDTATRFSTAELVQCYKIISDNRGSSVKISADFVEKLICDHLNIIDTILDRMKPLISKVIFPEIPDHEFEKFLKHWHFTVFEQNRLRRLLRQLKTLNPRREIWSPELESLRTAKNTLHFLEAQIRSTSVAV